MEKFFMFVKELNLFSNLNFIMGWAFFIIAVLGSDEVPRNIELGVSLSGIFTGLSNLGFDYNNAEKITKVEIFLKCLYTIFGIIAYVLIFTTFLSLFIKQLEELIIFLFDKSGDKIFYYAICILFFERFFIKDVDRKINNNYKERL